MSIDVEKIVEKAKETGNPVDEALAAAITNEKTAHTVKRIIEKLKDGRQFITNPGGDIHICESPFGQHSAGWYLYKAMTGHHNSSLGCTHEELSRLIVIILNRILENK